MTCGIYLITHRDSGKAYVGQSRNIEKRWNDHRLGSSCPKLNAALGKHGVGAFRFEVIEVCCTEMLNEREAHHIRERGTMDPHGYNLTAGGEGIVPSEETRGVLSAARKSVWADPGSGFNQPEYRQKQSETHKRLRKDPNAGYNSDAYREKRRESAQRQWADPEYRQRMLAKLETARLRRSLK